MPVVTVRLALEQGRTVACPGPVHRRLGSGVYGPQVIAVYDGGWEAVGARSRGDIGTGGRAGHRRELGVEVVLAHEHKREPLDRRHIQALVEVALVRGAVPEEADRDSSLLLGRQTGPQPGGDRAADDPVAADQAVLEVDHVH
jgi:hypothetical protein